MATYGTGGIAAGEALALRARESGFDPQDISTQICTECKLLQPQLPEDEDWGILKLPGKPAMSRDCLKTADSS